MSESQNKFLSNKESFKLFIGGFPVTSEVEDLTNAIGVSKSDIFVLLPFDKTLGSRKGYAILYVKTENLFNELVGKQFKINDRELTIRKYEKKKVKEIEFFTSRKIVLQGLPQGISNTILFNDFSQYGELVYVFRSKKNPKGQSQYGFMEFRHQDESLKFLELGTVQYKGCTIYIKKSKPKNVSQPYENISINSKSKISKLGEGITTALNSKSILKKCWSSSKLSNLSPHLKNIQKLDLSALNKRKCSSIDELQEINTERGRKDSALYLGDSFHSSKHIIDWKDKDAFKKDQLALKTLKSVGSEFFGKYQECPKKCKQNWFNKWNRPEYELFDVNNHYGSNRNKKVANLPFTKHVLWDNSTVKFEPQEDINNAQEIVNEWSNVARFRNIFRNEKDCSVMVNKNLNFKLDFKPNISLKKGLNHKNNPLDNDDSINHAKDGFLNNFANSQISKNLIGKKWYSSWKSKKNLRTYDHSQQNLKFNLAKPKNVIKKRTFNF